MFAVAVALFALGGLVTAARRHLTRLGSRVMATVWQLGLVVAGVGVVVVEHDHLGSLPRCVVTICAAFVASVLLDAAGATKVLARGMGG